MRLTAIFMAALLLASPLVAEPGLPDEAAVQEVLDEHPAVVAARARVEAARARAQGLRRGPHEFTLSGSYTRRRVDLGGEFDEYDAQLTRAIRLPGKARLDREIGEYGIVAASNLAEDARHQAALLLATHWFDWLSATALAKVDQAAVINYEQSLVAITRRMELRDAAQLDVDQARAALAEAQLALDHSEGSAAMARARLEVHFPRLPLPIEAPDLPRPEIADARLSQLRDQVVANSHEIGAAQAETRRMASVADRMGRDRLADPSVGVRLFSEFGGAETGAGLIFSIPLGGGHRRALAGEATANASAARAEESLARFNVEETADADLLDARYRIAAWQRSREAVDAQTAALFKLRRGYELGEIDLTDLLLGERMVHDAFRMEAEARCEAMRAITKLRIDSHALWLMD
ncbi:transporter [Erythrobacter longus]|uniref:Transporter n=1 Tax=Erythrobacter longus TaxID=1044 RepID=A0A074MBA8_ERYLO|nr:TolC family protein [Erythrobacter longus]KEO89103.1 transporter [Erythrobacter longus]